MDFSLGKADSYVLGCISSSPEGTGNKKSPHYGGSDYWVQKFALMSSTPFWEVSIGGIWNDVLRVVKPSKNGGYIVGGSSLSPVGGNKTTPALGGWDFWVVKLGESGQIEWQKSLGGNGT
jgi:hypothetical protein